MYLIFENPIQLQMSRNQKYSHLISCDLAIKKKLSNLMLVNNVLLEKKIPILIGFLYYMVNYIPPQDGDTPFSTY